MNSSVWRDVRGRDGGWSRSRDMIVGLRDGNRIWRVSPDMSPDSVLPMPLQKIGTKQQKNVNQNHAANEAFKSAYRAPEPIPACLTAILVCVASQSIFHPQAAAPAHSTPSNHVPMDIDRGWRKNLISLTCYWCHQPSHKVPDCPLNFDIRLMTIEELEMELMVKKDMAKVRESPPDSEEVTESKEDFVQNNKWRAHPHCLHVTVLRYCQIYRIPKQNYQMCQNWKKP